MKPEKLYDTITKFAWLPTRMSDRKLIWLAFYTVKLEGKIHYDKNSIIQTLKWIEVEKIFE